MFSRIDVQKLLESARQITMQALSETPLSNTGLHAVLQWIMAELDATLAAINSQWPLPKELAARVAIGRFAVRELEADPGLQGLAQLCSEISHGIHIASGL